MGGTYLKLSKLIVFTYQAGFQLQGAQCQQTPGSQGVGGLGYWAEESLVFTPEEKPPVASLEGPRALSSSSCRNTSSFSQLSQLPFECVPHHSLEDSMDMEMSPLRPQNYLFGCELKADKDDHFKVDSDENEHHNPGNVENVRPTISLGGFEITPPVVLRLKCGSGPVHLWRKMQSQKTEEDGKLLTLSGKRSSPGGGSKVPQKKVKLAADEDDDDDDFDDEETEEKAPEKAPTTPKGPSSVEDIKAKMQASIDKNGFLPKMEAKFIDYVKNCFR
ncbi:Nucleophosmin [Plecturocebus cupreus]